MPAHLKADLSLLAVTLMWGSSFMITQRAIAVMPVFHFLGMRFLLAFMFSAVLFRRRMLRAGWKAVWTGMVIGMVLFAGFALQTVGLLYTTTSHSAFITGLNVVMVPLFGALFLRMPVSRASWTGVVSAVAGLSLMMLQKSGTVNPGDVLTLVSAAALAVHILAVGHYSRRIDPIPFAIFQIGAVGVYSIAVGALLEPPSWQLAFEIWPHMLFLSIFCTAAALIIQNVAQKYTTSTHAALIFINEPVFAAMFGALLNGEVLGLRGIAGGVLMLSGILTAELDPIGALRRARAEKERRKPDDGALRHIDGK